MIAGYEHSTMHDAVIMIDGDLQHPPEYIPQMIEGYIEGYDQVIAKRNRQERILYVKRCLDVIIS